jgi:uncharacterized membrane protein
MRARNEEGRTMDVAVLVSVVAGFVATLVAVIGGNLQVNARLDKLSERIEGHVLDHGRHVG